MGLFAREHESKIRSKNPGPAMVTAMPELQWFPASTTLVSPVTGGPWVHVMGGMGHLFQPGKTALLVVVKATKQTPSGMMASIAPVSRGMLQANPVIGENLREVVVRAEAMRRRPTQVGSVRANKPPFLCYDAIAGTLVGEDSQFDGLAVDLTSMTQSPEGTPLAIVTHASLPTGNLTVPLCPEDGPWLETPPAEPELPPVECCFNAHTELLECPGSPFHGKKPQLIAMTDRRNPRVVLLHPEINNGNRFIVPLCPEEPPHECCYDAASGRLKCDGNDTWNGLQVALVAIHPMQEGAAIAEVAGSEFPGGRYRFRLCDESVPETCCYDPDTKVLACPGGELDGQPVGIVVTFTGPDGMPWVSVAWNGHGARVPVCPGKKCPPPQFCCVNIDTMTWVCPGDPTRNGTAVGATETVITDPQGFRWVVLGDGLRTTVPVCGAECPPPRQCPDCPTCPPGQWLSPDGRCTEGPFCPPPEECAPCSKCPECPPEKKCPVCEACPDCPPPTRCPECPKWPPFYPPPGEACPTMTTFVPTTKPITWWEAQGSCCERCALGLSCAGEAGGCNCGGH